MSVFAKTIKGTKQPSCTTTKIRMSKGYDAKLAELIKYIHNGHSERGDGFIWCPFPVKI